MGSFSVSTTSTNDITARIEWSESNVSIANNTSDLNVKLIYRMNASQYATRGSGYFKITVNGVAYEDNKYVTFASGTHEYTVIDHTFTITHDANGAKSVSIVVNNGYVAGTSGLSATSGSGTATLTTIARATVPSAASPCHFGSAITVSMPRASDSFVHQLVISIGQAHIYETAANLGTSFSWTIPASWADVCYNSTSSTLTIGCRTYSGSTQIGGTQVINLDVRVPDSWKPTVSISKTLTNAGDNSAVIVGVTTVKLTASATAPAGTGIASYSWSGAVTGTGASKTHVPSVAGKQTYTVTATDQRGRSNSATVTVDAVVGSSSFTCANSVNFGSALALTISRKKSSFTHSVEFTINSSYTHTLTGQGTSASYTIPTSWAASVPSGSSINMTVKVTTYNGSTSLGSTSKTVVCTVPSSWVPAFNVATAGVSTFNGLYLKGVSKVTVNVTSVSASTGSSIKSYSISGPNLSKSVNSSATSYSATSDILSTVGTNTYTIKVTDNRGRTTTKTTSITLTDYASPTLKLSVRRYTSGGAASDIGDYGRMVATGTYSAVTGNTWTLTLKQKKRSDSSYTTVNTYSNQTGTISKTSDLFSASVDSAYDCQATLTDAVGKSVTITIALSTGKAVMDFFKDKVIGFFSTASETLRTTLGSAKALLYSAAERTYLNGRVFVPKPNSNDGLTDGWMELNQGYIHNLDSNGGTAGFYKICRLTLSGTYLDVPFEIVYGQRVLGLTTSLFIQFAGGNTSDPILKYFGTVGSGSSAYIVKVGTGVWDVYLEKTQSWDVIGIVDFRMPKYASDRCKVVWTNEFVTSLPSGYVTSEDLSDIKNRSTRHFKFSSTTVPEMLETVRYTSGAMGSTYINTDYSYGSHTIPVGWFNFLYIPHGTGGMRRGSWSDNHEYGNLFLYSMYNNSLGAWRVCFRQGSIVGVWDLDRIARYSINSSFISVRSKALVAMTSAPNSRSVASALSVKSPNGAWDICTAAWDNLLHLAYTTDTDYNAGTNTWNCHYTFNPDGRFSGTAANVYGTVAIANGGTGKTTSWEARAALGMNIVQLYSGAFTSGTITLTNGANYQQLIILGDVTSGGSRCSITVPTGMITTGSLPYQIADNSNWFTFGLYKSGSDVKLTFGSRGSTGRILYVGGKQ